MLDAFDRLNRYLEGPPKVTQEAFSELVGVSQAMVSKLRRRKLRPQTMSLIAKLNSVLKTTFEDWQTALLEGEKRPRRKKAA